MVVGFVVVRELWANASSGALVSFSTMTEKFDGSGCMKVVLGFINLSVC